MRRRRQSNNSRGHGTSGHWLVTGIILNVLPPFLMIIAESTEPYGRSASVMMQKVGLSRRKELQFCQKRSGDSVTIWKMLS